MTDEEPQKEFEEIAIRDARPDDIKVTGKNREKDVIWDQDGERLRAKVEYMEVSWAVFADLMFECTDTDSESGDKFNVKKYLLAASQRIVKKVAGQIVTAKDPYSWRASFGFALMDADIIPKPSFGGGGAKNQ